MSVIRWEDPGPRTRAPAGDYWKIAAELRANPGRWAVVREGTRMTVIGHGTSIQTGKIEAFRPAGSFEATCRSRDGKVVVYARYVGEDGTR